jgi:hypothetical protein
MIVEIKFIPYVPYDEKVVDDCIVHLGTAQSKEECLRLIGEDEPRQLGVYEYIVHTHKKVVRASSTDRLAVEKTLDKIFETP